MIAAILLVGWLGAPFLALACIADDRAEAARARCAAAHPPYPRSPRAAAHHPPQHAKKRKS